MKNHQKESVAFLHDLYRIFKKHNLALKNNDDHKKLLIVELDNDSIKKLFDCEERYTIEDTKKIGRNGLKHQTPKHPLK